MLWKLCFALLVLYRVRAQHRADEDRLDVGGTDPSSRLSSSSELDGCSEPSYTVRILSYEPLMVHIENFMTDAERRHLLQLSQDKLKPSMVRLKNGTAARHPGRTSSSADLPTDDNIAACVLQRASQFQGYVSVNDMELQVTHYQENQQYQPHYDWKAKREAETCLIDRSTTFFGILDVNCEHCGTQFPKLAMDWTTVDSRWCSFVDCDESSALTVRPVPGSAIFWRNLDENGHGDRRMLHAGMPAIGGVKAGLNIWTKVQVEQQGVSMVGL